MKSAVLLHTCMLLSMAFGVEETVAYKPQREQLSPQMHPYSDGGYGYYMRPGGGVYDRHDSVQPLKDNRKPVEKGSKLSPKVSGYGYMKQSGGGLFDLHGGVQPLKDGRNPQEKGSKPASSAGAQNWGSYAGGRGGSYSYTTRSFLQKHLQKQQQMQPVQWQHYSNAGGRPAAHAHY